MATHPESFKPELLEDHLKADLLQYRQLLRKVQRQLAVLPQDHIHLMNRGNSYHYYRYTPGICKRTMLPLKKELPQIHALCQAEYLSGLTKAIATRSSDIEALLQRFGQTPVELEKLVTHEKKASFVTPLLVGDDRYAADWQSRPHPHTSLAPGVHITSRGENVRSKSEVLIAEALRQAGIPYRYEEQLILADGTTLCPDFHILNPRTRKEYFWEHFGMMDDEEYVASFITKLKAYAQNGYILGNKLLATFETRDVPLRMNDVKRIIEAVLS